MPLPNTEQNVLPKNSPEIALRKLARAPKIKLEVSSKTEVKVKIKEIVPKFKEKEIKSELEK